MEKGGTSSLDVNSLQNEMLRLKKEVKKLKVDIRKRLTKLEKDLTEKVNTARAMIAILVHRIGTSQQVLAKLNNEMEVLHSKFTALEKENIYLKELAEKQEKWMDIQNQRLMQQYNALAERELRIQALESISYDGVLLWRIDEVKRLQKDAVFGRKVSFDSPVFYTSRHGYKLSVRVHLTGDGPGKHTHMSMFFMVMRGRHDALLPWPFQQKVTFILLDQNDRDHIADAFRPDPASRSFKKPSSDMNIASGCPLFVTQNLLNAGDNYIKDDTMFIKVVVDLTGLENL